MEVVTYRADGRALSSGSGSGSRRASSDYRERILTPRRLAAGAINSTGTKTDTRSSSSQVMTWGSNRGPEADRQPARCPQPHVLQLRRQARKTSRWSVVRYDAATYDRAWGPRRRPRLSGSMTGFQGRRVARAGSGRRGLAGCAPARRRSAAAIATRAAQLDPAAGEDQRVDAQSTVVGARSKR